ncbi:hypothetical protein ACOKFD_15640 [Flagellimonas sp. S174]|uniref:hypothetical protein n=1 Tax=Flagellimonas sp. S174 TaxID=3410790 RepID=UPI003BF5B524
MEKSRKITLNGVEYPIGYKYGAVRFLSGILGTKGYDDTVRIVSGYLVELQKAEKKGNEDIPWEISDGLINVIIAGVYSKNPDVELDKDDVGQAMLEDVEILKTVFIQFMEDMPRPPKDIKGTEGSQGKQVAPKTRK